MTTNKLWSPKLVLKLPIQECRINDVIFIPHTEIIINCSEDRWIRIYNENQGRYWVTHQESVPASVSRLVYSVESNTLYAALENGTIMEFLLTPDKNGFTHVHDYLAHYEKITDISYSFYDKFILSVSRDNTLSVFSSLSHLQIITHAQQYPISSLCYSSGTNYCFIGDVIGNITLLKIQKSDDGSCRADFVRLLKAHTKTVNSLSFNKKNFTLASGSDDGRVIVWEINETNVVHYQLVMHSNSVSCVSWWTKGLASQIVPGETNKNLDVLISSGTDGILAFWLITPQRKPCAVWNESDTCQLCNLPFFWNIKGFWNRGSINISRQHHCRMCGKAVCDNCSPFLAKMPKLGFELPSRVCSECNKELDPRDQTSLCNTMNTKSELLRFSIDDSKNRMLSIDKDKLIKIWDLNV